MWKVTLAVVAILAIVGIAFLFIGPGARESGSEADLQLLESAHKGDLKGLQDALAKGANVNYRRQTPLADRLLGKVQGEEGYTALHYFVQWPTPAGIEAAKLLIEKGADINAQTGTGNTPLMLAANHTQMEIVKMLLADGADPMLKNKWGATAKNFADKRFPNDATRAVLAVLTKAQEGK